MTSDRDLILDSLGEFSEKLQSSVPLRHFSEYHDEARIMDVADKESSKVLKHFTAKVYACNNLSLKRKGGLLNEFCMELENMIEDYQKRNRESKAKAESFLEKRIEDLCEDFKSLFEAKRIFEPKMSLKAAEEYVESGKMLTINYFQHYSNYGNVSLYEEKKKKFMEKLDQLGKEMLEKVDEEAKKASESSAGQNEDAIPMMTMSPHQDLDVVVNEQVIVSMAVTHEEDEVLANEVEPEKMDAPVAVMTSSMEMMVIEGVFVNNEIRIPIDDDEVQEDGQQSAFVGNEAGAIMKQGDKRSHDHDKQDLDAGKLDMPNANSAIVTLATPKKFKQMTPEEIELERINVNRPDASGEFPLLRAISKGQSVTCIQKMLEAGANVNIKSNENSNAACEVISALINKMVAYRRALDTLDLLMANGFNLLNDKDTQGISALHYAMEIKDLDEQLLDWFYKNGGDFNSVIPENGDSVLFHALVLRQSEGIIRKILEYGGDPLHKNKWQQNAIHRSILCGHEGALKIFIDIDKLDVNERTITNLAPLHLLFVEEDYDYENSLKMLLGRGADFGAKTSKGFVPLVAWIKDGKGNPFPTFMKMKDVLPITEDIASATLTAIVEEIKRLQLFFPFTAAEAPNEFIQFISFLIEDKGAKLRLKYERRWKLQKLGKLEKVLLETDFLEEMKTTGSFEWSGELGSVQVKPGLLGKLEFHIGSDSVTVCIENVLRCLLACKSQGFAGLCQFLGKFCDCVGPKK